MVHLGPADPGARALALPFDEGAFNALIEHVPDPEALVQEVVRVCRPDGGLPARAEAEELVRLVRERRERRLRELRAGVRRWAIEGRPSLIVSGGKGRAP